MSDDEIRDDIDFEPEDEMGDIGAAKAKLQKLRAELKEAQAKAAENLAGWQRCKADSINERRDAQVAAERRVERAKDAFVEDLLPALDSFDMAMKSASWDAVAEEWRTGMGHVRSQLLLALENNGITSYGTSGERFDPSLHEAVQEVDDGDAESHTILTVLRHGYRAGERVIRPAQVIVRK